jgi:NAD(P)-dependent dehydrogenase (short-subunit alcohol dehydrogenase family)
MAGRLVGKAVLISGGSRGQGAADKLFAREGAQVVLADILDDEGEKKAREIEAAGGAAVYVRLDVSKEE